VLREVCWPPGCAGISQGADPRRTVARLVAKLERSPLRTVVVDSTGTPHRTVVPTEALYLALLVSDTDPLIRVDLPAAIHSALNGDGAYLARLLGSPEPIGNAVPRIAQAQAPSDDDIGRFLATTCLEARLPWKPDAPLAGRDAALRAQLATLAPKLVPFPPALVASFAAEPACAAWPPTTPPSPTSLAAPAVPTLILSGREDLRTPLEDARRTAAEYLNVRLLTVPDTGHSVLTGDFSGCALRGLVAFLGDGPVPNCPRRARSPIDPAPFIPANIDAFPRVPGVPGPAGRTLTAVVATLVDASRAALRGALEARPRVGGLRRGTVTLRGGTFTLRSYETVRGVRVSGTMSVRGQFRARLTVSGPRAAAGTLTLTGSGITGALGGQRISVGGGAPLG
jgi:pimeloyl-ACP methyl ester carboxylesterase